MKVLLTFMFLLAQLAPQACNRSTNQTPASESPAPATVADDQAEPLELTAIELNKVRLDYQHKFEDKDGKEKVYEEAWLVLLSFKNLGPVRDLGRHFYIGDYRIPEYGGFKGGIYFRIYDERLLQSLDGKEISVSLGDEKMQPLNKKFTIEGYKKLSIKEESAVLKR